MIVFVMGASCAGKSTYIKENYPDFYKVDLYDFQKRLGCSFEAIVESYEQCRLALIEAVKEHENVVMEHTLLRAIRRQPYIEAVREVTDSPIEIVSIFPSDEELLENAKKRKVKFFPGEFKSMREVYEIPTIEEGFSKVTIIDKNLY